MAFDIERNVSRETLEKLKACEALVRKWNPSINLISKSTIDDVWDRHIVDSLQITPLIPKNIQQIADFGSGGGFPGIVIAAFAQEHLSNVDVTLVESDKRKAVFLRTSVRELGLNANVIDTRVESMAPLSVDFITARALSSLNNLFEMALPHSTPHTRYCFPKGRRYQEEIEEARQSWQFEIETHPSLTDNESRILEIWDLKRVS